MNDNEFEALMEQVRIQVHDPDIRERAARIAKASGNLPLTPDDVIRQASQERRKATLQAAETASMMRCAK
jgi:hypothetical protein